MVLVSQEHTHMSPSIVPGNVLGAVGDKQIDPGLGKKAALKHIIGTNGRMSI